MKIANMAELITFGGAARRLHAAGDFGHHPCLRRDPPTCWCRNSPLSEQGFHRFVRGPVKLDAEGFLAVPDAPGIGIELNEPR